MFDFKLSEERKEFRESYIFEQKKKVLLGMMDILILSWIKTVPLCGQDIMDKIKKEYGVSIGSGTMYPILFNLHDKGIVNTTMVNKKKLYHLTEKGKEIVDGLIAEYLTIQKELNSFFSNGNSSWKSLIQCQIK